ncbi:MAG: hypothetical protein M0Q26_13455 [Chitinophagaceae bacterium]|nr:hypothetical protein [Chitinophagaceae bacterium]
MEQTQDTNGEYVRGFNHAYLLAEHEPQLLSDITRSVNPSNEYFEGFFSGKAEWELEQSKSEFNEIEQLREPQEEHNRDLDQPKNELDELDQLRDQSEERDNDLDRE